MITVRIKKAVLVTQAEAIFKDIIAARAEMATKKAFDRLRIQKLSLWNALLGREQPKPTEEEISELAIKLTQEETIYAEQLLQMKRFKNAAPFIEDEEIELNEADLGAFGFGA